MTELQRQLFALQDKEYREFHAKLIPNVDKKVVIGVRVPAIRNIAREIFATAEAEKFLENLPHRYFDENQLHALLLNQIDEYKECLDRVKRFLPYVDNWATCDVLRPKVFAKYHEKLIKEIPVWLRSDKTYTVRFGIEMLLVHFLEDDFQKKYLDRVVNVKNEDYYVRMMQAWFFAEAAVKQYETTLPYFEKCKLTEWTHNKAIQKVQESYRISQEHKNYMKSFKMFHVKHFI